MSKGAIPRGVTYSYESTEKFCTNLIEKHGYEPLYWNEGCLLSGDRVMVPPKEHQWYYIIQEHYLNMYSSDYKISRVRKIPKKYQKWLDEYAKEH